MTDLPVLLPPLPPVHPETGHPWSREATRLLHYLTFPHNLPVTLLKATVAAFDTQKHVTLVKMGETQKTLEDLTRLGFVTPSKLLAHFHGEDAGTECWTTRADLVKPATPTIPEPKPETPNLWQPERRTHKDLHPRASKSEAGTAEARPEPETRAPQSDEPPDPQPDGPQAPATTSEASREGRASTPLQDLSSSVTASFLEIQGLLRALEAQEASLISWEASLRTREAAVALREVALATQENGVSQAEAEVAWRVDAQIQEAAASLRPASSTSFLLGMAVLKADVNRHFPPPAGSRAASPDNRATLSLPEQAILAYTDLYPETLWALGTRKHLPKGNQEDLKWVGDTVRRLERIGYFVRIQDGAFKRTRV